MGNTTRGCARGCLQIDERPGNCTTSIVPEQDPLLASPSGRVQRCEIGRDFEMKDQVLGTGYSGAVRLAKNRATGQQVAVKQFSKRRLKPHRLQLLQSEVEVYLRLDHPNICRLLHAYEGQDDVWLVMELCGGELYGRLSQRKTYRERDAAYVMLQMLQAVSYLHAHRVVHRDLKLENWMYGATDRSDRLKLIDFGFSRILGDDNETLDMPCGTLHYMSPEVLSRKYTSKCDIWSLGVICYMLLIGRPPFRGANNLKIARAIVHDDFTRDARWLALSNEAQSFLTMLLQKDASKRPDAMTALRHAWIGPANLMTGEGSSELGSDVLRSLKGFALGSHLRRAALTRLAYGLTSRELQDMEDTFLAFDKNNTGIITLEQLAEAMQKYSDVTSQEVARILHSLDFSNDEELHYTPFMAAMLASKVKLREDKVRTAFQAFDQDESGFITADGLVDIFHELVGGAFGPGSMQGRGLTKEEAEAWIREVDYKGNGVIDYDGFRSALMGKKVWGLPSLDSDHADPLPTVRVFDGEAGLPRGLSDSFLLTKLQSSTSSASSSWRLRQSDFVSLVIDGENEDRRSRSFHSGCISLPAETKVHVRSLACDINEMYFA